MARTGPELVIGLAGAVGTDLDSVYESLERALHSVDYDCLLIHLAKIARELPQFSSVPEQPLDQYINGMMNAGDELRDKSGSNEILALLGMGKIQSERSSRVSEGQPIPRHSFVIRSLKHPAEVEAYRQVYGRNFYLLAAYSPRLERRNVLARKIATGAGDPLNPSWNVADAIIERDQSELGKTYGQNLQGAFHLADCFVDASEPEMMDAQLQRFVEIAFGHPFQTPSRDEYVMFHAQAAALRSSEPGRQVGAAIADQDGNIVAVGANEVPKAGGGLLWPGDLPDHREFTLGFDSSEAYKRKLLIEFFAQLRKAGWLADTYQQRTPAELASEAVQGEGPVIAKQSLVRNVIEFGRAVHAEMAAIDDAARRGVAIAGCTMFVTTFPCHLCARHIIASGIRSVRYIEPYPRSLAAELYPACIDIEPTNSASLGRGAFQPFLGIAPRQYLRLFTAPERKSGDGELARFVARSAQPRSIPFEPLYLQRETAAIVRLKDALKEFRERYSKQC